jgi:hypothetical protein
VDIPRESLCDLMHFTRAKTKPAAILRAITAFTQRRRMARLVRYAGTLPDFMSGEVFARKRTIRERKPR